MECPDTAGKKFIIDWICASCLKNKKAIPLQSLINMLKEFLCKKIKGRASFEGFGQIRNHNVEFLICLFDEMAGIPEKQKSPRVNENTFENGRGAGRERGEISGGAHSIKKKKEKHKTHKQTTTRNIV